MAVATSGSFQASVVTPEAQVLEATVTAAQIPAFDGLQGILSMHAPLLTKLGAGVCRLDTTEGQKKYFVSGGFAQMKENVLSVLADEAIPLEKLSADLARAELTKAEALPAEDPAAAARRTKAIARANAMRAAVGA